MDVFVFDIDGTLSKNGSPLTELDVEMMNNLLDKGNILCLASGRALPTVKLFLNQLKDSKNKYAICSNGADIYDGNDVRIYSKGLTFKDYLYFMNKYVPINSTNEIYTFNETKIASFKKTFWVEWEIKTGNMDPMVQYSLKDTPLDTYVSKILIASKTKEESLEIENKLNEEDKQKYKIVRSSPFFIEIVNNEAGKYDAIEFIRKKFGINKEDIHSFGDANNDYEMIKNYDGTAMGNAIDEIKKVAKRITKTIEEDGVGYILKEHFKF